MKRAACGSVSRDSVISGSRSRNSSLRSGASSPTSWMVGRRSIATGIRSRTSGRVSVAKRSSRATVRRELRQVADRVVEVLAAAARDRDRKLLHPAAEVLSGGLVEGSDDLVELD